MNLIIGIIFGILTAGAVIGVWAIIALKLPVEKMVGLDVLTTLITAVLVILSVVLNIEMILDIALVYAVLSFGAVVVLARFREGGI